MALTDYFEPFVRLTAPDAPDALGGTDGAWQDGDLFSAGICVLDTDPAAVAAQDGARVRCLILTGKDTTLRRKDRVRRVADGKVYTLTSDAADLGTPDCARTQFLQATAEAVSV